MAVRRAVLTAFLLAALAPHAAGQFAANDGSTVVVQRVGDGTGSLGSTATAVFLVEITVATGAVRTTVSLPTAASGATVPITNSGSATSEGSVTRSGDGRCIVVSGYAATVGTSGVAGTTAASVNRAVAVVYENATIDATTAFAGFNSERAPRRGATPPRA